MVIIGGGYTGISAALALARAGASVVVLEKESLGWGASTRNGGFVLPGFKRGLPALVRQVGPGLARRLFAESLDSIAHLESLITRENISCGFRRVGHLTLAENTRELSALEAEQRSLKTSAGHETRLITGPELASEIGSATYVGALLDETAGSLQPARLFAGLASAAARAGAGLCSGTDARSIEGSPGAFSVLTSRGPVQATHVLVATNGYSGPVLPAFRRRVIPIGSHIIATAPLGPALSRQLIPRDRVASDSRHLLHYFRRSADGRLVFGGRASFRPADGGSDPNAADTLQRDMVRLFPELAGIPVEYAWSGNVAFTLDQMPHLGNLDGVFSAGGYCGHGVAMAIYLGARAGQHLGSGTGLPFLSTLDFPAVPMYDGHPWFLPLAGAWYRTIDWIRRTW